MSDKKMNSLSASIVPCSAEPLLFNPDICIGCNYCVEVCQVDVLIPNPEKGKPPVTLYPGECYYCGCCVMECPKKGAVKLRHPLMNRAKFVAAQSEGPGCGGCD
jgi:NAD-dependent dihydropyrimidine dehydrogenase PreA subunit